MRTGFFAWLGALLFVLGCTAAEKPAPTPASVIRGSGPFAFPAIDDNLAHDTLLIQTTFDLGDMTYLMVASNMEETFEGLRLYRYRFAADSAVEMMAISPPAYDSWTMLPTCFPLDTVHPADAMWLLANFGEKESWGQKVLFLDWEFMDAGFMHVALPERVMEDDTLRLKRRNVAPHMRYSVQGDTSVWRFACDSVFLYEDGSGGTEIIVAAPRVRYSYHRDQGLVLWVDGQARPVRSPA
jgi:hypothetical protein